MSSRSSRVVESAALSVLLLFATPAPAQDGSTPLGTEQLQQLVAPIALYPDSLVAQILMASTYPLEVVEAARWVKEHPDLQGKALEDALESQTWDASVKSLAAFPQTLQMMNDELSWTTQLGDAFLAQQKDVMNAVQVLRQKAKAEGNLESNEKQTVTVEQKPTGDQSQTIIVQPANPQVVYVPTYNPTVVYGSWPYPAYTPFYWYPPGYGFVSSALSFGVGMAVGSALWGGCNWGGSNVDIDVNRYNDFNRTDIKSGRWEHDSAHRKGVQYRDQSVRNRYGGDQTKRAQSRDSFRGRAEQGRQQIARGDADRFKGPGGQGVGRTDRGAGAQGRAGDRKPASSMRMQTGRDGGRSSATRGSAFQGMGRGQEVRRESSRGYASRSQAYGGGGFGGGRGAGGGGFGGGRGAGGGGFGGGRGAGGGRGGRR